MPVLNELFFILIGCGFLIGILGVIFGGSMFLSTPLFAFLFPDATLGQIVGNIKIGSTVRGVASTWQTRKYIDWKNCFFVSWPFVIGAIFGARAISSLDQSWLLPMIVIAILITEFAERASQIKVPDGVYYLTAFAAGLYAGFIGIGIALLLVALLRLRKPDDKDIAWVKIQARFLEFIIAIAAISAHFLADNIRADMWIPWALGGFLGGIVGGQLLRNMQKLSPKFQKNILRVTYAFALISAILVVFDIISIPATSR